MVQRAATMLHYCHDIFLSGPNIRVYWNPLINQSNETSDLFYEVFYVSCSLDIVKTRNKVVCIISQKVKCLDISIEMLHWASMYVLMLVPWWLCVFNLLFIFTCIIICFVYMFDNLLVIFLTWKCLTISSVFSKSNRSIFLTMCNSKTRTMNI